MPNDSLPNVELNPVVFVEKLDKSGAKEGANALSTSLNLSIATPKGVEGLKSVKSPSPYVPSSASPILIPSV